MLVQSIVDLREAAGRNEMVEGAAIQHADFCLRAGGHLDGEHVLVLRGLRYEADIERWAGSGKTC